MLQVADARYPGDDFQELHEPAFGTVMAVVPYVMEDCLSNGCIH